MTTKPITNMGNPILREVCEDVSDILWHETQQIITDLIDTLENSPTPWVGIAAPQIWINKRICIIHSRPTPAYPNLKERWPEAIINPSIEYHWEEILDDWEWCLSIPGIRAKVPRWKDIDIHYLDRHGVSQRTRLTDFIARIFQHEYDHLDGILFIDKVVDKKSFMTYDEFKIRILGNKYNK